MNHTTSPETPSPDRAAARRRRGTVLGVTAGVLGGGLVGLAMTVPTFTNAASDTTTDDTTTIVADDTDATTDTATRPDPATHLRDELQALVDDGTLTAEQADAVAAHLAAQMPERRGGPGGPGHHGRGPGRHPGMDGEVVAELLGIDAVELRAALRDGQSIADLAEANGVDVQTVIDALVDEAEGHLDLAVEDGRLTEAEADERLADITERITDRVNGERPLAD